MIIPELMPKYDLEGCREHYDSMPKVVQALLRHEAWLQDLITEMKTHENSFQRREAQRKAFDSLPPK